MFANLMLSLILPVCKSLYPCSTKYSFSLKKVLQTRQKLITVGNFSGNHNPSDIALYLKNAEPQHSYKTRKNSFQIKTGNRNK